MQISFFEEFPVKKNIDKLNLVTWPAKLYLAAPSLQEFVNIKSQIKNQIKTKNKSRKIKEFIYWPVLGKKEGYWISPFSRRKALLRIFNELKGKKIPLMLDLELPTTQNPALYFTQLLNFPGNKKLIRDFIKNYQGEVYASEYFPEGLFGKCLSLLGLHYPEAKKIKVIKMIYHSMHPFPDHFIKEELKKGKEEFGDNFLAAYGVLSPGVAGNELLLSPELLEKDLSIAEKAGIKEVVIYRLGGVAEEYIKILKTF